MFRILTTRQLAVDLGIAVVCLLVRGTMQSAPVLWIVIVAMAAALALRRLSPALALGVAWVGSILQMVLGQLPDVSNIAILAVLFATARYGGRIVRWCGFASAVLGAILSTAYIIATGAASSPPQTDAEVGALWRTSLIALLSALALLLLSWTLGLLVRTWATARESRRQQVDAERSVVVEQERNRIARDMHDVVAHSLAVVIAQADGARYAKGVHPKDEALATIASTARDALADVRLLLGQLRHSQEAGPQPVLADLGRLVDQLRASGLAVDVVQHGEPLTLPAAQQLALYRIVQEALTNALRHGDTGVPASVTLDWGADAVDAAVASALRGGERVAGGKPDERVAGDRTAGHGVAGMRERALLVGGTLSAAPEGGRFVVAAHIPVTA